MLLIISPHADHLSSCWFQLLPIKNLSASHYSTRLQNRLHSLSSRPSSFRDCSPSESSSICLHFVPLVHITLDSFCSSIHSAPNDARLITRPPTRLSKLPLNPNPNLFSVWLDPYQHRRSGFPRPFHLSLTEAAAQLQQHEQHVQRADDGRLQGSGGVVLLRSALLREQDLDPGARSALQYDDPGQLLSQDTAHRHQTELR